MESVMIECPNRLLKTLDDIDAVGVKKSVKSGRDKYARWQPRQGWTSAPRHDWRGLSRLADIEIGAEPGLPPGS
jgi:hypothetical protein